jgi:glycosyltransferase involved in cell wall biosynthesis
MTERMRVLHVITGLGGGGAEAALYRLATSDAGNTHHVISLRGRGVYASRLEEGGVGVTTLGLSFNPLGVARLFSFLRLVRELKPDIIQTWMYHADLLGGIAARISGVPVVWGIRQTLLTRPYTSGMTIAVARVCAWMSKRVPAAIVSCSSRALKSHQAFGYRSRRMIVIPNGYDLSAFYPAPDLRSEFREEQAIPEDVFVIGMVARLDPTKDHNTLFAACKRLRSAGVPFHLVLVGAGLEPGQEAIEGLIKEADLGGCVSLLGFRADVARVMNGIDLHVLSSVTEAFPNVIAEAMACGTPCVTTDAGDAAQIVGEGGWVVPAGDPGQLADALVAAARLHQNRPEWEDLRSRVRVRMVDGFGIERMVHRFRELWAALVAVPSADSRGR